MKSILFRVTANDIKTGTCNSANNCPVAKSLSRKSTSWVAARLDYIYVDGDRYKTPPDVCDFIRHFDNGRIVRPAWFRLTA